ncbi:MAG: flagellar motor switch protein FliN [Leptospiraceae bacterium]|nr:MAG: flagellar motor switch protein FliN [Leptospiraceae bacterium]
MVDANMSQEEIDALLGNVDSLETGESIQQSSQAQLKGVELSPLEREKIADEVLQGLIKGIPGIQVVLNLNINIDNPYAELRAKNEVLKDLKGKNVIFEVKISGSLNGELYFTLPIKDAQKIASVLMGGNGDDATDEPLDVAQITTIKDGLNILLYSLVSHFSARIGETITPIGMNVLNGNEFVKDLSEDYYTRIQYNFEITGLIDTKILVILPYSMTKSLLTLIQKKDKKDVSIQEKEEEEDLGIPVKEVEFPSISTTTQGLASPNVDLLLDVQMTVTVELGRTRKYVKDILEMGEGSIIELDKQAGEHVDVLVNGKLVARGEVVVIDENFGVRITEIISPKDKLGMKRKER